MGLFDMFKVNDFKTELAKLSKDNVALTEINQRLLKETDAATAKITTLTSKNKQLSSDKQDLSQEANRKLSLIQMKPAELDELINQKNSKLDLINQDLASLDKRKDGLNVVISDIEEQIAALKSTLVDMTNQADIESYGLYTPRYDFANSLTYKEKLNEVRQNQKLMIKNETATEIFSPMTLNGSESKGRSMQKKNNKQLLRCFNGESEAAINNVTYSNFERISNRISKSFEQLNKLNEPNGVRLTSDYLDSKIDELHIAREYAEKKQQEKEELREQRQREREEKAAQKEIAEQQKNIDKEIKHYSNVVDDLQAELVDKNDTEKEELLKQIQELKDKINTYNDQKDELDYRLQNSTAGYVYIISNIGSFGKDVVKIGVTRRLTPMDRIDELGSASVPFKFDVHALIFSYDAYKLESELHERFSDKRINKVNNRKEYFRLGISEVRNVLEEYKDLTIDFNETPDAPEYRQTLALEKK